MSNPPETFETERLLLRRPVEADAPEVAEHVLHSVRQLEWGDRVVAEGRGWQPVQRS